MRYRLLGDTGLTVSEIGFGAWGIGGLTAGETSYGATDDKTSLAALACAFDCGITFYDTSNAYGDGRSEALIGAVFANRRDRVVIATKAGIAAFDRPPDFSPGYLRRSLDDSLRRLRTDYVDVLQLHNPAPDLLRGRPEILDCLRDLQRAGKIRSFGASVKSPAEALPLIRDCRVPIVQANLNMLDIRAFDSGLFDRAREHRVGVIARTPLCFGFLSGAVTRETDFPPGDHRRAWPRAQIEQWIAGADAVHRAITGPVTQSKTQTALRFCLSFAGVSTVIPGMLTPVEVAENAAASDQGPVPQSAIDRVLEINRRASFLARA